MVAEAKPIMVHVNRCASSRGGAERYVMAMAEEARDRGWRNFLLYHADEKLDPAYCAIFDGVFPFLHPATTIPQMKASLVLIHRWDDADDIDELVRTSVPVVKFFHDHDLFCLRRHKYTAIGRKPCTRKSGLRCYPCLGFVGRADGQLCLRSLSRLKSEQRSHRQCQAFVVASRYMKEHVAAHGFSADHIHRIPLFVDERAFVVPKDPLMREKDLLLTVSALTRGKGIDLVLAALAKMRASARLVCIGEGPQRAELEAQVQELGLRDRVQFLGFQTAEIIDEWYRKARATVFAVRAPETFGLVGVESFARGTPVVGCVVGGVGDWLMHNKTGLAVPSNDSQALACALDSVLSDDSLHERLSSTARTFAAEHTRQRHADSLFGLVDDLRLEKTISA